MRKLVFVGILLAFFAATAMGEGNRWYSNCVTYFTESGVSRSGTILSDDLTFTFPKATSRYDILWNGVAKGDTVRIYITDTDGDVTTWKPPETTLSLALRQPFYGPKAASIRVVRADTANSFVSIIAWY